MYFDATLIFPPGWSLHSGGMYIASPLLIGYAKQNSDLSINQIDLNIELPKKKGFLLCENEILEAYYSGFNHFARFYESKNRELTSLFGNDNVSCNINEGLVPENINVLSSQVTKNTIGFSYRTIEEAYHIIKNRISEICIAFSIASSIQLFWAIHLSITIRKYGYKGKIILGGNIPTRLKNELKKDWLFEIIDGFIIWSGEKALLQYINAIKTDSFENVNNLIYRKYQDFVENASKFIIPADFAVPDFEGLEVGKYNGINYIPLLASRGCYYGKCTFCSIPFSYGKNGFLGNDSLENIVSGINIGLKYNVSNFKFMDEALFPKTIKELSKYLLKNEYNIAFEGYGRFDEFWTKHENLELCSKAGLRKVYFGLEIMSKNRKALNKNDSMYAIEILELFKNFGIKIHLFVMIGYPGTSVQDAINTVEFCLKNVELIDSIDVSAFSYAKHTFIPEINPVIDDNNDWSLNFDYDTINKKDLTQQETKIICEDIENLIWDLKPEWLHPAYRMVSSWI